MSADPTPKIDALRAYRIALVFLIVTAATGALLRAQALWPQAWIDYRQLVHGHSHTAFYGWVFNVVFAFALLRWIEPEQRRRAWWLFLPAFTLSELLIILPVLTTSLPTWIVHNTSIALFILAVVQMLTFCLLLPSREISNWNVTTQASECLKG